jgi:hypothetical protein
MIEMEQVINQLLLDLLFPKILNQISIELIYQEGRADPRRSAVPPVIIYQSPLIISFIVNRMRRINFNRYLLT